MKLKIGTTGVALWSNRILSTLLLLIVPLIIFQEFQDVCSLPIKKPQIQSGQVSQRDGKKESRKPAERRRTRRDIGLVGANETAAGVIYHVNEREYL
jgi:hypothetical protein